jgi:hypothetical protein
VAKEAQVVGQRARTLLVAGSLLASGDLGTFPPTETDVMALAVKQGQYPPNLTPGQKVAIYLPQQGPVAASATPAAPVGGVTPPAATGQVVSVSADTDADEPGAVVELEVPARQAGAVAGAQGASLVELDGMADTQ